MLRAASYECDGIWEHKAILRALKRIEMYDLLFCQVSALEKEDKLLTWVLSHGRDIPLVACAARSREQVPAAIYERCTFMQVPFERQQLVSVVQRAFEHCDQTAKCYEMRGYVINILGYLELVQGRKPKSALQKKAIAGAIRNTKAAAKTVETLYQSLRKAHS
jgi:DNA-binding NtrC family response regulator